MEFNKGASLDTSEVQDYRGSRRVGAIPIGAKSLGGGVGVIGLVIVVALNLLGGGNASTVFNQLSNTSFGGTGADADNSAISASCRTGADANERDDCRIIGVVNSVQNYWSTWFTAQGDRYSRATTRFFTDGIDTGCGSATSASGPFYCPPDQKVYIDLAFFDDLQKNFGAEGGPFAQAYVIAHEYGHHVQNLLGTNDQVSTATGATSGSVKLELQADCFAGVWANHATTTPTANGQPLIAALTDDDIRQGLDAAAAVGDDRIQERYQGEVNPDMWTHGSAAQRQQWFKVGFNSGLPEKCDTFTEI